VVEIHALVALEADEPGSGGRRERLRRLGLADARLALEQERLLELGGQVDGGGERAIGQVVLLRERGANRIGRAEGVPAQAPAAFSRARRVSTRARWRL
jgi:hypothetical protein